MSPKEREQLTELSAWVIRLIDAAPSRVDKMCRAYALTSALRADTSGRELIWLLKELRACLRADRAQKSN